MAVVEITFAVRDEHDAARLADALSDAGFALVVGDVAGNGWTVVATSFDHPDHDRARDYIALLAESAARLASGPG